MNLFVTDPSPVASATALDDRRLVKMTLETAQIICTALHGRGVVVPYRPTHAAHPVVRWASESDANLGWTTQHLLALAHEYSRRFGRVHASAAAVASVLPRHPCQPPDGFANCARRAELGIDFTGVRPVHLAYRLYMQERWSREAPKWTNAGRPSWAC